MHDIVVELFADTKPFRSAQPSSLLGSYVEYCIEYWPACGESSRVCSLMSGGR